MSTPSKRDSLPLPPLSPGPSVTSFMPPSPSASTFLRPDHSTVVLPSSTPILTPPASPSPSRIPSRSTSPLPEFTDKYGGYGVQDFNHSSKSLGGEDDLLLSTAPSSSSSRNRRSDHDRDTEPISTIALMSIIILGLIAFILLLGALGLHHHTNKVAASLKPFVPRSVARLLQSTPTDPIALHPILTLLVAAREGWKNKVASQSTTFDRATRTYKARYNRAPPPGFDKWFAFATQGRNHSLVDEYDSMMEDLLPFRSLSPHELRRRTAELASVPGISVVSIRNGAAQVHSKSGKWAPALAFQQMIGAFVRDLPDMDIAVNEKPEGRVLPRRQREIFMSDYGLDEIQLSFNSNTTDKMLRPTLKNFTAEWKRDGTVWDAYRRSCPTESASRRFFESIRSAETSLLPQNRAATGKPENLHSNPTRRRSNEGAIPATRELSFADDFDANLALCSMPSMHNLHSAFFSDQRSIEYLFPLFSASKPSGYGDILIPSHHYWQPSSEFTYEWELKRGRTTVASDIDWEKKNATSYWRGKVTRGADTPPGHGATFQKQRLVKLANQGGAGSDTVLVKFNSSTAGLSSVRVPMKEANAQMTDVAMACDPNLGECSYLRQLGYRVEAPAPLSQAWKHKYVLDLDEIGLSPRFLALMESKSAVVKNSIQREFWRSWIQPWYHYLPLSSSYAELYNIQTFFTGLPDGVLDIPTNSTTSANALEMNGTSSTRRKLTELTTPSPVPTLPHLRNGNAFNGDGALQEIAEQGSEWRATHVRKADMECYVYRLMVEWAAMVTNPELPVEPPQM